MFKLLGIIPLFLKLLLNIPKCENILEMYILLELFGGFFFSLISIKKRKKGDLANVYVVSNPGGYLLDIKILREYPAMEAFGNIPFCSSANPLEYFHVVGTSEEYLCASFGQ